MANAAYLALKLAQLKDLLSLLSNLLIRGHSTQGLCRQIVVEDVEIHEGEENVEVRRLVFVANSSLIQSEAQVIPGKNGKAGEVDPSRLCMNYHKHILAGLLQGIS